MVRTDYISLDTRGNTHVIDITRQVEEIVRKSGVRDGIVTIFSPSSTSGVTTIEYESGAISDLQEMFERVIPSNIPYRHNLRWGDGNGHSHIRASLLGASFTVPIVGGSMTLGTWQQVVFVDFDNRPRRRRVVVQIVGE
jgi:secondary thiamine-phosphate synthase enzyme